MGLRSRQSTAKASKSTKASAKEPTLLSGGNPQIAKGDGDAPVQAYIAAMPGWKREVGRRLDALIVRTVPDVRKAVRWNTPFYGSRGPGLVPRLPLHHEVRQGGFPPRHIAASCPPGRVQERGHALPPHLRGRPARRGARKLDQAGIRTARGGVLLRILREQKIVPTATDNLMREKDPERLDRISQAVLKMKKFDLAAPRKKPSIQSPDVMAARTAWATRV